VSIAQTERVRSRESRGELQNEPSYLPENQLDPISVDADSASLGVEAFVLHMGLRRQPPPFRAQLKLDDLRHIKILGPGPACVDLLGALNLISGFHRDETAIENKLYRATNQLKRLERTRKRGFVRGPESTDVSIHSQPGGGEAEKAMG
jgi:hypothetical protein